MPKSIIVANPKGGCGKTTIATQIAGWCAVQGYSVIVIDHDKQQSMFDWARVRPSNCPKINVSKSLNRHEHFDVVIHDMPAGIYAQSLKPLVQQCDKLIIPIVPSPTDIKAGVRFLMTLSRLDLVEGKAELGLVANRVRKNTVYYRVLASFLRKVNIPVITVVRDTQNYVRTADSGISIFDLPPSRVAKDIRQWRPLLAWLALC